MNYIYSVLGTSLFFLVFFALMDWETKKREARAEAEYQARYKRKP